LSRDWSEVFVGVRDEGLSQDTPEVKAAQSGRLVQLREGLSKSRKALQAQFLSVLFDRFDEGLWERIEEALIRADIGVDTTVSIVEALEAQAGQGTIKTSSELIARLRELASEHFCKADNRIDVAHSPAVILMAGVNGTGKTTTIGKIAWHLKELGKEPLLVAGDTFRAAAIEQLVEWGRRVDCEVVHHERGGDPGAVVFDGLTAAEARKVDVVIGESHERAHQGAQSDRETHAWRAARDPRLHRRHHRTERADPGAHVQGGGGADGSRTHQDGWHCQGRHRSRDIS
jgi:fused signal recognition particle receptor